MKAIRIVDAEGPNPAYNKKAATEAKLKGKAYEVPKTVTHKAGDTVDDPDCWILCVVPVPLCKPSDDECKAKVEKYLSHPARKAQIAKLKKMASPAVFKTLPKGMQQYVTTVAAKWLDAKEQPPEVASKDADTKPSPKK